MGKEQRKRHIYKGFLTGPAEGIEVNGTCVIIQLLEREFRSKRLKVYTLSRRNLSHTFVLSSKGNTGFRLRGGVNTYSSSLGRWME